MEKQRINLLLVEDSPSDIHAIRSYLAEAPDVFFAITVFKRLDEALAYLKQATPDLIVSDLSLPDSTGIDTFRTINRNYPNYPIVVLTGFEDERLGYQTVKEGAQDFISKGTISPELLIRSFRYALERKKTEAELRDLNDRLRKSEEALKRAHQEEASIAGEIQRVLLLGMPPESVPGAALGFYSQPSLTVDGDFFDFFKHGNDACDLLIADVMGKGIPAALIAAATKATFLRAYNHLAISNQGLPSIKSVIDYVDRELTTHLERIGSYVTLIFARFDFKTGRMIHINLGHPSVMHYVHSNGTLATFPPLNVFVGSPKPLVDVKISESLFSPGDVFLFYSDGIVDPRNEKGEMFGVGRLQEKIIEYHEKEPMELITSIRASVEAFAGRRAFPDDFTAVVVKIR